MCGIFGLFAPDLESVVRELLSHTLDGQHRGQDSAGAMTCDGNDFYEKKGLGWTREVFQARHISRLKGNVGISQVRYATAGNGDAAEIQPFKTDAIMLAHNGNLTNNSELRKRLKDRARFPHSASDSETLLYLLTDELFKQMGPSSTFDDLGSEHIFNAVEQVMKQAQGSYSVIAYIKDKGFLAFRDPKGYKPLVAGKRLSSDGISYLFASEDRRFKRHGYEVWGDINPGQAVFIGLDRTPVIKNILPADPAVCSFEIVYFAQRDSKMFGVPVYRARREHGTLLAHQFKARFPDVDPDVIGEVPDSAVDAALGMSSVFGGDKYEKFIVKNHYVGRTFIEPNQLTRVYAADAKLNVIDDLVKDKIVVIVDDSLVRGTTMKKVIDDMKSAGAKKIYVAICSPPIRFPCYYGTDTQRESELIAANLKIEEVEQYLGVNGLLHINLKDFAKPLPENCCMACFNGEYPTPIPEESKLAIANQRNHAKGEYKL